MHVSSPAGWPVRSASDRTPAIARTSYHELADWALAAGPAIHAEAQPSPFDRFEWLERTARLSGQSERPIVLAADNAVWLPLEREGLGRARALASWYTLAFRPVFSGAPARSPEGVERLAEVARKSGLSRLTLSPVPEWDGTAALISQGFRRGGWLARVEEATGNWIHRMDGQSWSAYLADRPGTLRSTIRRKGKRAGLTTHLHRTIDADLWRDYATVFADSWKGDEGSLPFLQDMMEAAERDGSLRLGFARADGRAIATQLWTVEGEEATIHKLAYRDDARSLSPGTVLSAAMFESAIDRDRVALIDYGTGDDAYKRDWMTERRRLMRVTLTDPASLVGTALVARDRIARLVADARER